MKKSVFIGIAVIMVMLMLSVTAYSWQGRMGGMGDPYGLTPDESDFLIHPALIANGKGLKFYSNFDYTYTGISQWDLDIEVSSAQWESFDGSGDRQDYGALLGSAFSAGPGRLGVFFAYDGSRQDKTAMLITGPLAPLVPVHPPITTLIATWTTFHCGLFTDSLLILTALMLGVK